MESKTDVVAEHAGTATLTPAAREFDLFVLHAVDSDEFVRGYLLPALNLPLTRVLLADDLRLGATLVSEIERGVSRSRITVAVLSPAFLTDHGAVFGAQLASYVSLADVHVIPLRLTDGKLPLNLEFRVSLDFTSRASWDSEVARLRELLHTTVPAAEPIPCGFVCRKPGGANSWASSTFRGTSTTEHDEMIPPS